MVPTLMAAIVDGFNDEDMAESRVLSEDEGVRRGNRETRGMDGGDGDEEMRRGTFLDLGKARC